MSNRAVNEEARKDTQIKGANKLEAFEIKRIGREQISLAEYNPRRITESAKKKLQKFLKENGLWSPLIVNKRTMTLVSGHQRLACMDAIIKKPDYDLTVSMVDVDEHTEVKGNIFMNNQAAQGEWDVFMLESIAGEYPDLDFVNDLGFDLADVDVLFGGSERFTDVQKPSAKKDENAPELTAEDYREMKKEQRENAKDQNAEGSYKIADNDYTVTIVFPNNLEKQKFMKWLRKPEGEKFLKSTALTDMAELIKKGGLYK
jgi:hypothetical protein